MDNEETRGQDFFGSKGDDFSVDLSLDRSIITARGTGEGLVIRVDGRAGRDSIKEAFESFIDSRRRFLAGNDVSIEWTSEVPQVDFVDALIAYAKSRDVDIASSHLKEPTIRESAKDVSQKTTLAQSIETFGMNSQAQTSTSSRGLFGGIDSFSVDGEAKTSAVKFDRYSSKLGDAALFDEADARIIASTIRGGQKIETEHSIVVFGDVNSGAELIAGGDIIVLGTLRGVAHAGAYDETGGGRVIFALNLQPTQLRIGAVISRGAVDKSTTAHVSEIARVDGTSIVVEPYQAKAMLSRRKDA
jgi:septum site-determining protein MinC